MRAIKKTLYRLLGRTADNQTFAYELYFTGRCVKFVLFYIFEYQAVGD